MGKVTVESVLMLCLVVGMLVGQSTADSLKHCFDECVRNCLNGALFPRIGNSSPCYPNCSNGCRMYTKVCIFGFCFKIKSRYLY